MTTRSNLTRRLAALFALLILPAFADAADDAAARLHAAARAAVEKAKTTAYQHTTDIDEKAGRYLCDCSGFVVHLLRQTLPRHLEIVPKEPGRPRPNAANFHDLAAALPESGEPRKGWTRVGRLGDARAGDVLVWRHNDPKPGSTGHVMIVGGTPQKEHGQYRVTVLDAARSPHDRDTRAEGANGIGRGDVFLTVDKQERPQAWRWASPAGQLHEESILILRPAGR